MRNQIPVKSFVIKNYGLNDKKKFDVLNLLLLIVFYIVVYIYR